jgi:uncharacterized membrane protein YkvA (DUF1232 family)
MLKALKHQLKQLQAEADKSLERRFMRQTQYDVMQANKDTLQNFVLCLPDLLEQMGVWFASPQTPQPLRQTYGHLLAYVYHAGDVLPDEEYGFWGYLDDAYLVGAIYQKTLSHHPNTHRRFDDQFDVQINAWLEKTRAALPKHTEYLDSLVTQLLAGDYAMFEKTLVGTSL